MRCLVPKCPTSPPALVNAGWWHALSGSQVPYFPSGPRERRLVSCTVWFPSALLPLRPSRTQVGVMHCLVPMCRTSPPALVNAGWCHALSGSQVPYFPSGPRERRLVSCAVWFPSALLPIRPSRTQVGVMHCLVPKCPTSHPALANAGWCHVLFGSQVPYFPSGPRERRLVSCTVWFPSALLPIRPSRTQVGVMYCLVPKCPTSPLALVNAGWCHALSSSQVPYFPSGPRERRLVSSSAGGGLRTRHVIVLFSIHKQITSQIQSFSGNLFLSTSTIPNEQDLFNNLD